MPSGRDTQAASLFAGAGGGHGAVVLSSGSLGEFGVDFDGGAELADFFFEMRTLFTQSGQSPGHARDGRLGGRGRLRFLASIAVV